MALPLAGAKIRASDLATVFPTGTDAWTAYTPTLTQGVAVSKTSNAQYFKVGRFVVAQIALAVTSTGTALNQVTVGLPVPAVGAGLVAGIGGILDTSAGQIWKGMVYQESATTFGLLTLHATTGGRLGADGFTAALASGDTVWAEFKYQAAS